MLAHIALPLRHARSAARFGSPQIRRLPVSQRIAPSVLLTSFERNGGTVSRPVRAGRGETCRRRRSCVSAKVTHEVHARRCS
jgi:hypothetical protein